MSAKGYLFTERSTSDIAFFLRKERDYWGFKRSHVRKYGCTTGHDKFCTRMFLELMQEIIKDLVDGYAYRLPISNHYMLVAKRHGKETTPYNVLEMDKSRYRIVIVRDSEDKSKVDVRTVITNQPVQDEINKRAVEGLYSMSPKIMYK